MNALLGLVCGLVIGVVCGWLAYRKYGVRAEQLKDKVLGE